MWIYTVRLEFFTMDCAWMHNGPNYYYPCFGVRILSKILNYEDKLNHRCVNTELFFPFFGK